MKRIYYLLLIIAFLSLNSSEAKVKLPNILSDNMVLQQQTKTNIWGKASPNKPVVITASWSNQEWRGMADNDGKWLIAIDTPVATYDAQTLTISDDVSTVYIKNILVGEVWFCSGQSNMEMPLRGFWNYPLKDSNELIATSGKWKKNIRFATVQHNGQLQPVDDCPVDWQVCEPRNAPSFSAAAYYFATMVTQVLDVPVGIIHCSWGGSMVEGWLPESIVKKYPDIDLSKDIRKEEPHDWWHYLSPIIMYNGMLHPLVHYTIKGFLWYQGESNVGKEKTYGDRLFTMVSLWRKLWGQGDIPFYMAEIAPFGSSEWNSAALLREAQFNVSKRIPNCGFFSTNDLVEPFEQWNVHPQNKKDVGHRFAWLALQKTYHVEGIESDCPSYKSMAVKDSVVILSFDHANEGFNRMTGMTGFEIAGSDGKYYTAQAEMYQDVHIKVWSDKVKDPVSVRYAFYDFAVGNVANVRGLPLIPFRTDK